MFYPHFSAIQPTFSHPPFGTQAPKQPSGLKVGALFTDLFGSGLKLAGTRALSLCPLSCFISDSLSPAILGFGKLLDGLILFPALVPASTTPPSQPRGLGDPVRHRPAYPCALQNPVGMNPARFPQLYGPTRGEERLGCISLSLSLQLTVSETADSAISTSSSEICCLKHQL